VNHTFTYGGYKLSWPDPRSKERRQLNEADLKLQAMAVLMQRMDGQIVLSDVETLIGIHLLERDDQLPKTRRS
jgi:hypothetical protein